MDKLICVGKNYLDHAKELGDAVPALPVLFLKPPSVLRVATKNEVLALTLPRDAGSVHHECEVVVRLGKDLSIDAVSLGLDMTLRDRQAEAKKAGAPWETSKVFRDAAVVGPWLPASALSELAAQPFRFSIHGKVRQEGRIGAMRVSPADCVSYAGRFFPLVAGDILFTGTPAGVGPVVSGDEGELAWGPLVYRVRWS